MTGLDIGSALHCARIAQSHYRHAGKELPERLREYLAELTAIAGSPNGTSSTTAQSESRNDDLIDTGTAAQILGCSTRYVRRIANSLDAQRICGRWLFRRDAVTEYATGRGCDQHD